MSFMLPATGRRLLVQSKLTVAVPASSIRAFGTTSPLLYQSNRSKAKRKSPHNQAIFVALKPELGATAARYAERKRLKAKQTLLDPEDGETVASLEAACEQLKEHAGPKASIKAVEVHIVTTVDSHQTNAFRGRIVYPRDPRKNREQCLVFAEDGSAASEAVKRILKAEKALQPTTEGENSESAASGSNAQTYQPSLILGGSELIKDVVEKRVTGFTRILTTSTLLPQLSRTMARTWGPKGLMPSARRGTVVAPDDEDAILAAIEETQNAADWRSDKVGVVRASIGRVDFPQSEIRKNFTTLLDAIIKKVPLLGTAQSTLEGGAGSRYVTRPPRTEDQMKNAAAIIKQVHLSSSHGPGIKLHLRDILA